MEPKVVDFSVIKQKIIKTDEVLQMYLENDKKLKRVQLVNKNLKVRYEQATASLNRLQLETERYTYTMESTKSKSDDLQLENQQLMEQKSSLEQKYSNLLVDSQSTILELQDELKMIKDLTASADQLTLSPKKRTGRENNSSKKIKELEVRLKKVQENEQKLKEHNEQLLLDNKKIIEELTKVKIEHSREVAILQLEKSKVDHEFKQLCSQIDSEKRQHNIVKEKEHEISKLKAEVLALRELKEQIKSLQNQNKKLNSDLLYKDVALYNAKEKIHAIQNIHTQHAETQTPSEPVRALPKCSCSNTDSLEANKISIYSSTQTESTDYTASKTPLEPVMVLPKCSCSKIDSLDANKILICSSTQTESTEYTALKTPSEPVRALPICSCSKIDSLDANKILICSSTQTESTEYTALKTSSEPVMALSKCSGSKIDSLDANKILICSSTQTESTEYTALKTSSEPVMALSKCSGSKIDSLDANKILICSSTQTESTEYTASSDDAIDHIFEEKILSLPQEKVHTLHVETQTAPSQEITPSKCSCLNKNKTMIASFTQTLSSTGDADTNNDAIDDIFKEMLYFPRVLSPMRYPSYENLFLDDTNYEQPTKFSSIPDIIVTPSTPLEENQLLFGDFSEERKSIDAVENEFEEIKNVPLVKEDVKEDIKTDMFGIDVSLQSDMEVMQYKTDGIDVLELKENENNLVLEEEHKGTHLSDNDNLLGCDNSSIENKYGGHGTQDLIKSVVPAAVVAEQKIYVDKDIPFIEQINDPGPTKPAAIIGKPLRKRRLRPPTRNNNCIKQRRARKQAILLNKRLSIKKEFMSRKLKTQDSVLRALQVLKRSKINFTISNESTLPLRLPEHDWLTKHCRSSTNYVVPPVKIPKFPNIDKRIVEKLRCPSCCCNNMFMLLSGKPRSPNLHGFFKVKKELVSPLASRMDATADDKPENPLRWLNESLKKEITPENLLDTLAELVSQKLRNDKVTKRKRSSLSDNSEFYSETETEIERLFQDPKSTLERNKMLLKKAKDDRGMQSTSVTSLEENDVKKLSSQTGIDSSQLSKKHALPAPSVVQSPVSDLRMKQQTPDNKLQFSMENNSSDCFKFYVHPDILSPLSSSTVTDSPKQKKLIVGGFQSCFKSIDSPDRKGISRKVEFGSPSSLVKTEFRSLLSPMKQENILGEETHSTQDRHGDDNEVNENYIKSIDNLEEVKMENSSLEQVFGICDKKPKLNKLDAEDNDYAENISALLDSKSSFIFEKMEKDQKLNQSLLSEVEVTPNSDTCINKFLKDESEMSEEVGKFICRFDLSRSFRETSSPFRPELPTIGRQLFGMQVTSLKEKDSTKTTSDIIGLLSSSSGVETLPSCAELPDSILGATTSHLQDTYVSLGLDLSDDHNSKDDELADGTPSPDYYQNSEFVSEIKREDHDDEHNCPQPPYPSASQFLENVDMEIERFKEVQEKTERNHSQFSSSNIPLSSEDEKAANIEYYKGKMNELNSPYYLISTDNATNFVKSIEDCEEECCPESPQTLIENEQDDNFEPDARFDSQDFPQSPDHSDAQFPMNEHVKIIPLERITDESETEQDLQSDRQGSKNERAGKIKNCTSPQENDISAPVKRKRGRPRKQINEIDHTAEFNVEQSDNNLKTIIKGKLRNRTPKITENEVRRRSKRLSKTLLNSDNQDSTVGEHNNGEDSLIPYRSRAKGKALSKEFIHDDDSTDSEINAQNTKKICTETGISKDSTAVENCIDNTDIPCGENSLVSYNSPVIIPTKYSSSKRPKSKITKLKANILRQMKLKREMFQTDVPAQTTRSNQSNCDLKNSSTDKFNLEIKEISSIIRVDSDRPKEASSVDKKIEIKEMSSIVKTDIDMPKASVNKKINVVQNFLITPGNSNPVDLLKAGMHPGSSTERGCEFIPTRRKPIRKAPLKHKPCDILSQIMGQMDRDRPAPAVKPQVVNKDVPIGIEDKQWRKGVLDIAEIIHNKDTRMENVYERQSTHINASGLLRKGASLPCKMQIMVRNLVNIPNEDDISPSVILEFKRLNVDVVIDLIIREVAKDFIDKPINKYYPAPLMTRTQRIYLNLLVTLEKEKTENVLEMFLNKTQLYIFRIGCGKDSTIPLTRVYLAVCRLKADINRMRMFCCEAFFYVGDLAVPILFTVLTSWVEVLPMAADVDNYPMANVLVQLVQLKTFYLPGYNLIPLKCLLHQYHGYPKERRNCDEVFEEVFQHYLRNPTPTSEFAIRLFCRNKETKWVYKKINEFLKPLIYKIPTENVNFKSTVILLMGKICRQFRVKDEHDQECLVELNRFFAGLIEDDMPDLVRQSVHRSIERLPKKKVKTIKSPTPSRNCEESNNASHSKNPT